MRRLVIVASRHSYRTGDFVTAAGILGVEPIVVSDAPPPVAGEQLQVDLADPPGAAEQIAAAVPDAAAVVAIDDQGVRVAAAAAAVLGLPHNSPSAVEATRDKYRMRCLLDAAGVPQPRFAPVPPGRARVVAGAIGYPVVLKPVGLSASRGVIRVDDEAAAGRAERRIRGILAGAGLARDDSLLAEEYIGGAEVIVEGLLVDGALEVLAVIDKPDEMSGPFFEETMLVTPSRLPADLQAEAIRTASEAATAIGLERGPVHVELRVPPGGPVKVIEAAARSIGGLCGRALSFGLVGESLESLVLRSALGMPAIDVRPARPATGVLMLPIPATGTLSAIEGVADVEARPAVDAVTLTVPIGRVVEALPEGDRYLGFVFAGGADAQAVEEELRVAAEMLTVLVDGEQVPVLPE